MDVLSDDLGSQYSSICTEEILNDDSTAATSTFDLKDNYTDTITSMDQAKKILNAITDDDDDDWCIF